MTVYGRTYTAYHFLGELGYCPWLAIATPLKISSESFYNKLQLREHAVKIMASCGFHC